MHPGGPGFGPHNHAPAMPVVGDAGAGGADKGILALVAEVQRRERAGFGEAVEIDVGVLNGRPAADEEAAKMPVAAISDEGAQLAAVAVPVHLKSLQTGAASVVSV